jgi:hypothetical protein
VGFVLFYLKSQFLFFSDIPEFQVDGPENQQIKNMWPSYRNHVGNLPAMVSET